MNRLTRRHSDGSVGISQFRYYNYDDFQKLARKLAEYEDLDEKGLVLKLPCKLGDTLHWFDSFGNYQHSIINCIYIENGLDDIKIETMCCTIDASELNKTIFLTKEELMRNEY